MSASEYVRALLERVAAEIGVDARGKLREDSEGISAAFVGEDLGLLGHHGQTIDAIQHLTNRIAFRRCGEPLRIQTDARWRST